MSAPKPALWALFAAALTISLSGCAVFSPAPTPTPDLNPMFTQVAGTVQAGLTQAAALTPSATPTLPPTNTPVPTATQTDIPTPAATATPAATDTATPSPDQVAFLSQAPTDDSIISPKTTFTLTWTVKNTGTTTWGPGYRLRFYSGDQMGGKNSYPMPKTVAPGDTVAISITLTSPEQLGRDQTIWVLTNSSGRNFYAFTCNFRIDYAPPATDTPTVTPTGTLTVTPTVTNTPSGTATATATP